MWSEAAEAREGRCTPVLSLFSLPEMPGMLTPPRLNSASIPFLWEEAPGKPREPPESEPLGAPRSLELPPRLLNEAKQTTLASPTTVLDGPYFGSRRSGSFRKMISKEVVVGDGFDLLPDVLGGGSTKVELGRPRRRRSLSIPSYAKSHFLVNIYESFKQAVPWRRRQR